MPLSSAALSVDVQASGSAQSATSSACCCKPLQRSASAPVGQGDRSPRRHQPAEAGQGVRLEQVRRLARPVLAWLWQQDMCARSCRSERDCDPLRPRGLCTACTACTDSLLQCSSTHARTLLHPVPTVRVQGAHVAQHAAEPLGGGQRLLLAAMVMTMVTM